MVTLAIGKSYKITFMLGLAGAFLLLVPRAGQTQLADGRLTPLDTVAASIARLEQNPHFSNASLYGSARNLVSLADRWATVRPLLQQLASDPEAGPDAVSIELANADLAGGKPISKISLSASRYPALRKAKPRPPGVARTWWWASMIPGASLRRCWADAALAHWVTRIHSIAACGFPTLAHRL